MITWVISDVSQLQSMLPWIILCIVGGISTVSIPRKSNCWIALPKSESAYIALLDSAKFLSRKIMLVCMFTNNIWISVSPHHWQQNMLSYFEIFACQIGKKWYLNVIYRYFVWAWILFHRFDNRFLYHFYELFVHVLVLFFYCTFSLLPLVFYKFFFF